MQVFVIICSYSLGFHKNVWAESLKPVSQESKLVVQVCSIEYGGDKLILQSG